jgi:hypothetical protein
MIKVPVKTRKGVYRTTRTRVPRTRTFDLYRKAEAKAPKLLEQIYRFISHDVEARASEQLHRSGELMDRLPADWSHQKPWLKFAASESERRLLFEQVLWTYFFDRADSWETTWPDKGKVGAVYSRLTKKPPEVFARGPRPKRAAAPGPERAEGGRGLAPAAAPPAPQLSVGDIVEITRGRYQGLIGQITELVPDGPFVTATIKLPADAEYLDIPGFRLKDLRKAD